MGATEETTQSPTGGQSPLEVESAEDPFAEHPEIFVGAALAGGFILAQILKRLGSD
jgi:hypothetical protein